MEKLYELLFDYSRNKSYFWSINYGKIEWDVWWTDHTLEDEEVSMVIKSKEFWFIKWLVENEKINFEWMNWHANIIKHLRDVKKYGWEQIKEWVVLMLLSIQDNPIEFLVSILK